MSSIPAPKPIPTVLFNEEDLKNLQGHIDNLNTARGHIKLAQSAGIGVGDLHDQVNTAMDRLLKIKNVYFPGR